jgi:hypothetical protein
MGYLLISSNLRRFAPEFEVGLVPVDPDGELSCAFLEAVWCQVC